ncbi:MAG: tetratricopeptide repeat protein [Bryobacteraceae bacterium]|nr:tetratricopeptide repeat protein [Bryobacteraceae bacterium]
MMEQVRKMGPRYVVVLVAALLVNAAYIGAFASPSIFYMANVLLHLVLGAGFFLLLLRLLREPSALARTGAIVSLLAAIPAVYLIVKGNTRDQQAWLYAHVAIAAAGAILLSLWWKHKVIFASLAMLAMLPAATRFYERAFPNQAHRITNPVLTPMSMEEEGEGPRSPFWPASSRTNVGLIPSEYFLDSEQCGVCHKDVYEQWKSSVHHFSSFNNQFYRKSIEHMQEVQGSTKPSRWCAACHDHAVFFNGRWEKPIKDQIDTPEAQAGLGCLSCHAISRVHDTMGNSGFTLDYNWLHKIAASRNRYIQAFDRFLTYLNPEPHRRTFLKPFHRQQPAEFCSSCHKVHLDSPVNNYRWLRGFNDYDNWQASGVSGRGARSFYYPKDTATCNTCHMPLIASNDPGKIDGQVHNHRFLAANTAVPAANNDREQLELTKKFLESGFITADIFAASPVEDSPNETRMVRRAGEQYQTATSTFAVGEEAEATGQVFLREVGRVAAPLDKAGTKFQPGSTVRVDVVVRTRKIGHFFPAGTVDAFDVWLELEGRDATGRHVFWSGRADGPVEKGAHFYRSYQLDGEGNPINKRNAWQTRSVLYVRLIPPGAADTAHFRVRIPPGAKGPITLSAKLNYRKFSHYYTQYAYAGKPVSGAVDANHDSREYSFDAKNIPANVSGSVKDRVPDVPIVTLARAEAQLNLAAPGEPTEWKQVTSADTYERWNDWGIGMLLQGDLKGAGYAFHKVMEANPGYADGPLNAARALVQEGETDAARPYVEKALALAPKLARGYFFKAMVQKADGDYDGAIASLRLTESQYPEDRVVLNQLGRILFLKRQYKDAVAVLERVLRVDPEDLQAHYTLMLAYRGAGDTEKAEREAKLFRRFKADEASQTITARQRRLSPEDNNERQMIHDHESIPLPVERPRI